MLTILTIPAGASKVNTGKQFLLSSLKFKVELVENGRFESVEQARSRVSSYIEDYYNRIRRHSGLGCLSPLEFEKQLNIKNQRSRKSFSYHFS